LVARRTSFNRMDAMLPLDDPLWDKLDDAHRDRDIPRLLAELAQEWNHEVASSLLWDCLCHQGTCYGATYAAIPHLVELARPPDNIVQRFEIAHFLGYVVLQARLHHKSEEPPDGQPLPGLPDDLQGWDRKLAPYRSLLLSSGRDRNISTYDRTVRLPRYRRIVETGAVSVRDLNRIATIRAEFWSALPLIAAICERAYLESTATAGIQPALLGGVAAATGQIDVAGLLYSGNEGTLSCAHCGAIYQYICDGSRVAIYADVPSSSSHLPTDSEAAHRLMLDYRAGTMAHADGFVMPVPDDDPATPAGERLLFLAKRAQTSLPDVLLRNFLGSIQCCRCGKPSSIMTHRVATD
jgi:hypothetical protein